MFEKEMYGKNVPIQSDWSEETLVVQAGRPERVPTAPMNTEITLSSTYIHPAPVGYGRDGNEGWAALEAALGELDGGYALTFASGLAAASAIAELIPAGGALVLPRAAYYGVKNIFDILSKRGQVELRLVDGGNNDDVIAQIPGASMVWMESIANPTLVVADVPAIVAAAKAHGVISVVDATFATPVRQRPLELGADIVLHSVTKAISGHSDLLLGAVVCKSKEHATAIDAYRHDRGATPGSLEAYLALRGLRTLSIRVDKSEANAMELAKRLSTHTKVKRVYYPGLEGDSQFEVARKVLPKGAGAMVSFEIDAAPSEVDKMLGQLQLISHTTSLGGVSSSIERRTRWPAEEAAGVPMTLCRFSVGIENVEDIWADLKRVLG
ncbi:MAG: cystathionine gamma-synthase [Actinomycetota bacterium]